MLMSPRDCKENLAELDAIVIVPTFNNAGTIGTVMSSLIKYSSDILVVDDGCTDATAGILATFGFREISSDDALKPCADAIGGGKMIMKHPRNMGKGAALKNSLTAAASAGYRYAITV